MVILAGKQPRDEVVHRNIQNMKKNLLLFIVLIFTIPSVNSQIEKVEHFILNNQLDSAKVELSKNQKTTYIGALKRIIDNDATNQDLFLFASTIKVFGEIQYKKLNDFLNKRIIVPTTNSLIDLDYVKVKCQQIDNLRNELSIEEATSENLKLKKYISAFNQKDPDVLRAKVFQSTHDIVLHLINGNVKKARELCINGVQQAKSLQDTSLLLMTKYYYSNVLMEEKKLDEYIVNSQESLKLEKSIGLKSPYYEANIENLIDALIYKGDFDPEYIQSLLDQLYMSESSKYYSLTLYAKFLSALPKNSLTFKEVLVKFKSSDLVDFCDKIYAEAEGKVNSNELFHMASECSYALFQHEYFNDAFRYKNLCVELTKKTYTKELAQSIADLQTEEIEKEKTSQLEKEQQKTNYLILLTIFISIFLFVSITLVYKLRNKTKILDVRNREKEVLLTEIHHRVKNNFQLIIAFIRLKERFSDTISINDFIHQLELKMNSMSMVHEMLYKERDLEHFELIKYLNELGSYIIEAYENNSADIDFIVTGESINLTLDEAIPLGLIINEVLTNSIKHADKDYLKINIEISSFDNFFEIRVIDNGPGLPEDFDQTVLDSFGLKIINLLVSQMNSTVQWSSVNGTICLLKIPKK